MLNAEEMNMIFDALISHLEESVPELRPLSLGRPELVDVMGAYGSVVLSALFTGGLEGKMTLTLEWINAFSVVERITGNKVESLDEASQRAMEELFFGVTRRITERLAKIGRGVEIYLLPTLTDTSVLVSEDREVAALRIPIHGVYGTIDVFLAFR